MSNLKKRSISNMLLYNSKGETRLFLFFSFLIPFAIMWGMFIYFEVYPFGEKQILVTDLWHQYYPFFREEQDKLQNASSLLYSWNTGLGTNFLSVMSYYAASPLNLLSVFFPLENSREAMTLFLTVKIGCAGLFFAIFLKRIFKKNDITIVAFGSCYALCAYIMGYYWNLIWIDTVAVLPLVVLGTILLVREGKFRLYVISLAISLVANFYIGLFTCIFTVLVFGATVIICWKSFKDAFLRLGQIIGATVLGIGLGAFMLLPAFLALQLTNSADNKFPETIVYYETWFKMISNMIGFHEPTSKEGLPNLYCSMLSIVLLGVFAINTKIKAREKIVTIIYLAFIILSCNMNVLNYIWHGFHFTNMIPYRFSFLFSFILVAAAYRAFTVMTEKPDLFDVLGMLIVTISIALISYTNQEDQAIIKSVVFCGIYIAAVLLYRFKFFNKKTLGTLVSLVCMFEMGWNAYIGVKTVTVTSHTSYPKNEIRVEELLDMRADEESDFFRTEFATNYSINDPALYGVKGVSQFSSTANVNITRFLEKLGIQASAAGNRYYYTQSTPIMNSFLNIRYLITHDEFVGDESFLDEAGKAATLKLLENNQYLPIAFVADDSILDYTGESDNLADNQNELFSLATGTAEDVLYQIDVKDVGHKNLNVTKSEIGKYRYQYEAGDESDECYLKYNYLLEEAGPVYAVMNFSECPGYSVSTDKGKTHHIPTQKYKTITAVGSYDAGTVLTFRSNVEKDKSGDATMCVYRINEQTFRDGIEKLSAGGLKVTSYDDTEINGTFTAENDGVLYTSIPHDGGWTAYVDGEEAEITPLKDAFVCVPVKAGEHTLTLKYSPPGFVAGAVISVCSLIAFVAVWYIEKKYSVKVKAKKEAEDKKESLNSEIVDNFEKACKNMEDEEDVVITDEDEVKKMNSLAESSENTVEDIQEIMQSLEFSLNTDSETDKQEDA